MSRRAASRPAPRPERSGPHRRSAASPAASALAAALALSALVFTPIQHLAALALPKQTLLQLTAAASLLWISLAPERRARWRVLFADPGTRWLALSGCAWLAWSGASLAWSPWPRAGWPVWYGWAVGAGIALGVATLCASDGDRRRVACGLVAGACGVAALGIAQYLLGWQGPAQTGPPGASFENRNFAAEVVVLALPFAVLRFLTARSAGSARGWVVALAAVLMMGVYLVYVSSTAGWIAACVSSACVLGCSAPPALRGDAIHIEVHRLAAAAIALAIAVWLGGLGPFAPIRDLPSPGQELTQIENSVRELRAEGTRGIRASSVRGRIYAFRNTLPMLRDHPWIGVGLGGWRVEFPRYARRDRSLAGIRVGKQPVYAHNDYLQLLAECGLVGGLLLLGLTTGLLRTLRAALARSEPGEPRLMACACLASLTALAVSASVAFPLENAVPPAWTGAVLGLLAGLARLGSGEPAPRAEPGGWGRVSIGSAAVLALVVAAGAFDAWRYDLALSRVLALAEGGRDEEALRVAAPLLARDREDPVLLGVVGRIHLDHQSAEGLPLFEHIQRFDPWNPTNLMNLARSHFHAGHLEQAIELTRRALEIAPSCAWCQRFLARREGELEVREPAGPTRGSSGGAP
jgi:O-antigen ligase